MKILITCKIFDDLYKKLEENFEIDYNNSNTPLKKEEIIARIKDVDGLICPLSDKIDKEIISAGKNLKIIANYGAGFDNIDLEEASKNNIIVTNAPAPSSAVSTAELTFSLILLTSRRLLEANKDLKGGNFKAWMPSYMLGQELKGKTLGIIGLGNIGKNLAKRALAFEMNVLYYSRNRKKDFEDLGLKYMEKEDLIKEADIISLHTAYSKELHHMISDAEFKLMKKDAILINAARGPLLDEAALIKALKNKEIKAAGLDVYEFEPKFSQELAMMENVILLPHIGNATIEARYEMGRAVVDNLLDFKAGKKPRNSVN
ncbi:NAD(P)-dependent oxidoreductase [Peptoniphilus obesi]|uniref:NAD(P)-dependent oxidoreductase n=1 Tax=Peptoniphilus obesi TaxID=1472765 RepID=UPI0004B91B6B|nr:NAD(P)-dependent oxidoreductase [Peptoniphilus obesi]